MTGPKLNERATVAGERSGTKATAKYVRSSASKARAVLDLIRGLDVRRADEVLQFTDRGIAADIRKVLASAVANASDSASGAFLGDPEELFVLVCYADEGPTLRRFRPRARGRATRIRKRSCHITVVVARMTDERLEIVQARAEGASGNTAASRKARVERSRKRAESAKDASTATAAAEAVVEETEAETAEDVVETDEGSASAKSVKPDEGSASDESDGGSSGSEADASPDHQKGSASDESDGGSSGSEADASPDHQEGSASDESDGASSRSAAETSGDHEAGQWVGSVVPAEDGSGPDTHLIKGNAQSMLYHTQESRYYKATKAEVWFDTEENAEAAGFSKPGSKKADEENN